MKRPEVPKFENKYPYPDNIQRIILDEKSTDYGTYLSVPKDCNEIYIDDYKIVFYQRFLNEEFNKKLALFNEERAEYKKVYDKYVEELKEYNKIQREKNKEKRNKALFLKLKKEYEGKE